MCVCACGREKATLRCPANPKAHIPNMDLRYHSVSQDLYGFGSSFMLSLPDQTAATTLLPGQVNSLEGVSQGRWALCVC